MLELSKKFQRNTQKKLLSNYNKSKLNEEDVKSYETITSKAKLGGNLKEVDPYVTAPLFLSVGNTLFGPNGEDPKGTNWGNEAGVNFLNSSQLKKTAKDL